MIENNSKRLRLKCITKKTADVEYLLVKQVDRMKKSSEGSAGNKTK